MITRALGTEANVDVDMFTMEAAPGDLYLLCSDGLTTWSRDERDPGVAAAARARTAVGGRSAREAANRAGGDDNITVVVFEVVEGEPDPPRQSPPAARTGGAFCAGADRAARSPARRGKGGRALALLGVLVVLAVRRARHLVERQR